MATQYAYDNIYYSPEFEYKVEELDKRMRSTKANFAYLKFKRSMQKQLTLTDKK